MEAAPIVPAESGCQKNDGENCQKNTGGIDKTRTKGGFAALVFRGAIIEKERPG